MSINKRIDYSQDCYKQLNRAPLTIRKVFRKRLELFLSDPYHPQLRNHQLTGKFQGLRSINLTGDWRAIYRETSEVVIFVLLGTHSQLYK